mmetsp:Transcript_62085/g.170562  ORF Transcript_62085/g.170562 Transcript_62085/m.170562 type:complete len:386 (+) Transcript_62085:348-1505(+)
MAGARARAVHTLTPHKQHGDAFSHGELRLATSSCSERAGDGERTEREQAEGAVDELEASGREERVADYGPHERGEAKGSEHERVDGGTVGAVEPHRLRRHHRKVAAHAEEHEHGRGGERGARLGEGRVGEHRHRLQRREQHERALEARHVGERAPEEAARGVAEDGGEGADEREERVRVERRQPRAERLVRARHVEARNGRQDDHQPHAPERERQHVRHDGARRRRRRALLLLQQLLDEERALRLVRERLVGQAYLLLPRERDGERQLLVRRHALRLPAAAVGGRRKRRGLRRSAAILHRWRTEGRWLLRRGAVRRVERLLVLLDERAHRRGAQRRRRRKLDALLLRESRRERNLPLGGRHVVERLVDEARALLRVGECDVRDWP